MKNHNSKLVSRLFAIVLALAMTVPVGAMFSTNVVAENTENNNTLIDFPEPPVPPEIEIPDTLYTPPTLPPFERIEEPYNITLVTMESPTGPLFEGQNRPIHVVLKNKADHNIHDIDVQIFDQVDDWESVFLTDLLYGCIPKGNEQKKTFTWQPEAGTHSLTLNISYMDNGVEQLNEEEFGFYVISKEAEVLHGSSPYEVVGYEEWITDVELQEDLVIRSTGHLVINGCALTMKCPTDDQYSITVRNGGTLEVLGDSLITATQPDLTYGFVVYGTFKALGDATAGPTIQWMYGSITDATVPAGIQLHFGSDATFDYAKVMQGRSHNIYVDGAKVTISNSEINGAQSSGIGCGIYAINDAEVTVNGADISNNGHSGIYSTSAKTHLDGFTANQNIVGVYLKDTGDLNPLNKPYYVPGVDLGYFIWTDQTGYHVRLSSDASNHLFDGTIKTILGTMSFNKLVLGGTEQGIDFNQYDEVTFNLKIDSVPRRNLVFVGAGGGNPLIVPFTVKTQPVIANSNEIICAVGSGSANFGILLRGSSAYVHDNDEIKITNNIGLFSQDASPFVEGNTFRLCWWRGVECTNGNPAIIGNIFDQNSNVSNCGWVPQIQLNECGGIISNNIVIGSLLIRSIDIGPGPGPGLDPLQCGIQTINSNIRIEHNTIRDIIKAGLVLYNYEGIAILNEVTHCTFGIEVFGGAVTLDSNTLCDHTIGISVAYYNINEKADIINNVVNSCEWGITLSGNQNVQIYMNSIYQCIGGLYLSRSTSVNIYRDDIYECDWGIVVDESSYNIFTNNEITSNLYCGIYIKDSTHNIIYHNNFREYLTPSLLAYDSGINNYWDNGYPDGGNFWSDFVGPDNYHGPNQDVLRGDGIIDLGLPGGGKNPRAISGGSNEDEYPLKYPVVDCRVKHPGIRINNDAELSSYGFRGQGTTAEPWLIENYRMDYSGIYVGNTTQPFIIRNCDLYESQILLVNVLYGNVVNNIVYATTGNCVYVGEGSLFNIIQGNTITGLEGIGIEWDSNFNSVIGNTISGKGGIHPNGEYGVTGIDISGCANNNTIDGNTVRRFELGIVADNILANNNIISNNVVHSCYLIGIYIWQFSSYNEIYDNTIYACREGIHLNWTFGNEVSGNTISDCHLNGIYFHHSHDNIFTGNTIYNNNNGIYATLFSTNNLIYHNNFIENAIQAYDDCVGINFWDNGLPDGGNYWSDYTESDSNGDGIGDIPYIVDADTQDNYPWMTQDGWI